jgi:hypothetical protein
MPQVIRGNNKIVTSGGKIVTLNQLGYGLNFISTDLNMVTIADSSDVNFGTGDFTISGSFVWTGTPGVAQHRILSKQTLDFGLYTGYLINISSANLFSFAVYSGTSDTNTPIIRATNEIKPNRIYKYSVVRIGTTVSNWKIYLDETQESIIYANPSVASFSGSITNTGNLYLGAFLQATPSTYNFHFKGVQHYLKFHGAALSEAEIIKIHKSDGSYTPEANLKEAWNFNHKSGTTLKGMKGSDGTLINFANTSIGAGNQWVNKYQQANTS